jgi:hypothetical protein
VGGKLQLDSWQLAVGSEEFGIWNLEFGILEQWNNGTPVKAIQSIFEQNPGSLVISILKLNIMARVSTCLILPRNTQEAFNCAEK